MRKLILAALLSLCAVPAFAARTYYIDFAGGSDAAAGTAQGTAWKHAPGMQGCTGTCASTTPQGDDFYYMKKGVTWDKTALQWQWTWKGTAGHPIYIGDVSGWGSGTYWTIDGELSALASGYNLLSIPDSGHTVGWYVDVHGMEGKRLLATSRDNDAILNIGCARNFTMTASYLHDWDYVYANDRNGPAAGTAVRDGNHGGVHGDYFTSSDATCIDTGSYLMDTIVSNAEAATRGRQNGVGVTQFNVFGTAPVGHVFTSSIHDVSTTQLYGQIRNTEVYNSFYPSNGCLVVGSNQGFSACDSVGSNGHDPYHDNSTYFQGGDGHTGTGYYIYGNHFYNIGNSVGALYPNGCSEFWIFNNVVERTMTKGALWFDPYNAGGQTTGCGTLHIWNNTLETESEQSLIRLVDRGIVMAQLDAENNHFVVNDGDSYACDCNSTYNPPTVIYSGNVQQTRTVATAAGYTTSNHFAPTAFSSATVNAGANLTAQAVTALLTDYVGTARPAVSDTYRTTTELWDSGAYYFSGRTFYISLTTNSPAGSNSNNGTSTSTPFATFQYFINQAQGRDKAYVRAGNYREAVSIQYGTHPTFTNWSDAPLIKNYNSETVWLTAPGYGGNTSIMGFSTDSYPVNRNIYWKIDGINLDGAGNRDGVPTIAYPFSGLGGSHVRLMNLEVKNGMRSCLLPASDAWDFILLNVHNCGTDGQDHGLYWDGSDGLVEGGTYHHNTGYGIHQFHSSSCDGSGNPEHACRNDNVIRNAKIYNNDTSNEGAAGLILSTGNRNTAYNNWIYSNGQSKEVQVDYRCADCTVYNNTIVPTATKTGIIASSTVTNTVIKNNIIYTSGTKISDLGTGTVDANNLKGMDPLFTNAGNYDYTLTSSSPARAYGANLYSIAALRTDRVAVARPNAAFDAGADQYNSGACVPSKVVFTAQPAGTSVGASLGTISVAVQDSGSNTCTLSAATVTLTKHTGVCTGQTLNGTVSGAASAGIFTTSTANLTGTAGSCSLDADSSGLTGATSNSFTITSGSFVLGTSSGSQSQTLSIPLSGTGTSWANGTTVAAFGAGVTVNSTTCSSTTACTANITIALAAAAGYRDVTMTTSGTVETSTSAFNVLALTTAGNGGGIRTRLRLR